MATVDKDFKVKNSVTAGIGYRVRSTANPVAPTVALAGLGAGNVDNGTHYYFVTYVTANGETNLSSGASVTVADKTVNGQVTVTIPTSSDTRVTARKIYRNTANSYSWVEVKLLATINDNTTTTYTDNIADASTSWPPTGANTSYFYKDNTTTKPLKDETGNYPLLHATAMNTAVGRNSLATIVAGTSVGGSNNAFGKDTLYSLTTGAQNNVFGTGSGALITTGNDNVLMGHTAGAGLTTGNYNIFLGRNTGYGVATSGHNVFIGYYAGYGPGTTNQNPASNIAIGSSSLQKITTANNNVAIGFLSGYNVTTGGTNTALGTYALYTNSTGTGNVAVGYYAGAYETGTGYFYVNNQDRTNLAGDQTKSLLYGTFNATASSQQLTVNGTLNATYPLVGADTTDSSSTVTGAFKTAGGMGIAKTLYVGTGANIAGGKTTLAATTTGYASLNLPHGTAPSAPVDGDFWTTTVGAYVRVNGVTVGPLASSAGAGVAWGAITGTLSSQTDLQTALDAKLNLSGGTLTGDLTISKATPTLKVSSSSGSSVVSIEGVAGTARSLYFKTGSLARWSIDGNTTAESGSNAGSNLNIYRYNDAGTAIGSVLSISRSDGGFTFAGNMTQVMPSAFMTLLSSTGPSTLYLMANAGQNRSLYMLSGDGTTRWDIRSNSTTESGSNVGSDLDIYRYSDAGASQGIALSIKRSTGAATFQNAVIGGTSLVGQKQSGYAVQYHDLATLNGGNLTPGAWVLTTPIPRAGAHMVKIHVHGFQYANSVIDFEVHFYTYSANGPDGVPGQIYTPILIDKGNDGLPKYAGAKDGYVVLAIGDTTSSIAYPKLNVDALITHNSATGFESGWSWATTPNTTANFGWAYAPVNLTQYGQIVTLNSQTFPGIKTFSNTTDSSASTDGAVIVSGGLGVAKKLYVGTNLNVAGTTTLTGDLTISKASPSLLLNATSGSPSVNISGVAGTFRGLQFKTAGTRRWTMYANADAESGSDVGSDFAMYRANDAGSETRVMYIQRSTGNVTFDNAVTLSGDLTIGKASPVFTVSASSGNAYHVISAAASATAGTIFRSAGSTRWVVGKNETPDSSTATGSDFVVRAYDNNAALLSTPLTITRSTGLFTFTGDMTLSKTTPTLQATSGTGTATIRASSGDGHSQLLLDSPAGLGAARVVLRTGTSWRWNIGKNWDAESGANAGSNFAIQAYADDGATLIATPLTITRSTGNATFTGDLTVSKAGATLTASAASGNPGVYISGVSGTSRLVRYQTAGSSRWLVGASSDAESGTNAGSNYVIYAYDDAGASLGAKLTITRSTGAFSITGDVSIAKSNAMMTINSSSNATPAYFRVFRDAGQFGGMSINTGSTSRWLVAGNNTAEAGSDAGSDFIIRRYSDAGGSLGDALTITRSTGNATFSGTVTAPTFTPSTSINLAAVADTATAATHYYVETATDGLIRPKTLADVKTEVVTNAAVNSAAATTVGTVTSGTWQGTAINATYIDSAIARLASPTFTGTVTTPGVKRNVVTKSALYTLTASDHIVIATSGTWTATLPTAASIAGTEYIIKNSGSGIITVDPAGTETIDGSTTIDLAQYDSLTVVSDGTNWVIV